MLAEGRKCVEIRAANFLLTIASYGTEDGVLLAG